MTNAKSFILIKMSMILSVGKLIFIKSISQPISPQSYSRSGLPKNLKENNAQKFATKFARQLLKIRNKKSELL